MSEMVLAEVQPASAYYIDRVKRKQASGVYPMEEASCFCGHARGHTVAQTDRYGFEHRMMCCPRCGLLYASPRMTADAYRQFYEQEYRLIYGADDDPDAESMLAQSGGGTILQFIRNRTDYPVSVVMDFGCNDGGYLQPFRDAGCTVYGCDYNADTVAKGRERGLDLQVGGLDRLESLGLHADLVIANHVLEHCLDLTDTLTRLAALVKPGGLLFVGVPGLYKWDRAQLFQNAHVWQFTAETLGYVMGCFGFEEVYCDQHIVSLWENTGDRQETAAVPMGSVRQIMQYLQHGQRFAPEIRTLNQFPLLARKRWIDDALATGLPDIDELIGTLNGRASIIIGGGPSVEFHVEHLERLYANGAVLFTIERMLPWCLAHGLAPDYVVIMDASDDVIEALHTLSPISQYLVATQCQPAVFDKLRGLDVSIFNTPQRGVKMADLWHKHNRQRVTQVNAGGSVTLCAMSLAMTLGSRQLHVFGFDCHVTDGAYATGIAGVGEQPSTFSVSAVGQDRRYLTNAAYLAFAQQFFKLMELARRCELIETVQIYGDSLVKAMHKADSPLKDVVRL